ncbi:DUF1272 domain-containing protein [Agaribacter marinus]|uniref:DUF1272 domain-containing protein n=1 Tax=Agaribacter marinus TaxID=1431249 RepID=UPI0024E09380|nr:DUF1272 domain-containing protein [Agaribacter marinus]
MLILKPNCECCNINLPPESNDARICSFECTFCVNCTTNNFNDICPNCGGELVKRPVRPAEHLLKNPASTQRFINQKHVKYANFNKYDDKH